MTPEFVKTLVIDIDGVLYEWSKTARYMLRTYRGYPRDGAMGEESTSWNYIQDHVEPKDWDWLWSKGIELGLFRHGHVVTDGVYAINKLRDAGYILHALTHRPGNRQVKQDTEGWIAYHFPGVFADVTITQAPKADYDRGYLLIDDRPENCQEWRLTGRPAYLFDRPWNQDGTRLHRVFGWRHVLDRLGATR